MASQSKVKPRFELLAATNSIDKEAGLCAVSYTLKSLETGAEYVLTLQTPQTVVLNDASAAMDAFRKVLMASAAGVGMEAD